MTKKQLEAAKQAEHETALKTVLWATWQAIGDDYETSMIEAGERATTASAIETVLDADRPETLGARNDAEKAALATFREQPWDKQCRQARKLLGRLV